jgi:hypothetical protein
LQHYFSSRENPIISSHRLQCTMQESRVHGIQVTRRTLESRDHEARSLSKTPFFVVENISPYDKPASLSNGVYSFEFHGTWQGGSDECQILPSKSSIHIVIFKSLCYRHEMLGLSRNINNPWILSHRFCLPISISSFHVFPSNTGAFFGKPLFYPSGVSHPTSGDRN